MKKQKFANSKLKVGIINKRNAFTLIELLAIIVILAIIAVITVPIILNIIENSKEGAAIDSAYGYKDAINKYYLSELSKDKNYQFPSGIYDINNSTLTKGDETINITVSGKNPTGGYVSITNKIISGCLQFDEYKVEMENGDVVDAEKGICIKSLGLAKNLLIVNPEGATASTKSPYVNYIDKNGNTILSRVLYNDSTHGVQIISANSVQNVILGSGDPLYTSGTGLEKAQNSYNNAIENLNNYTMNYLNTNLAYDARSVGSVSIMTNNMMSNKNNENGLFTGNASYLTYFDINGKYKNSDTHYGITSDTDYPTMKDLEIIGNYAYWFASRDIINPESSIVFAIRFYSDYSGDISSTWILTSGDIAHTSLSEPSYIREGLGLRPVFLLKDNVIITGGEGTEESPYELGIK